MLLLGGALLLGSGCWSDTDAEELPIEADTVTTADELEMDTEEYAETRVDNVQNRVMELIRTVELRVDSLERWDQTANISGDARLRSERFRQDLARLREDLQRSLDSIDDVGDEDLEKITDYLEPRLEQTEDELDQINEQMNEWYDENIN